MRYFLCGAALLALAACDPVVPDSGAGVGFGDYTEFQQKQAQRDAQLSGQAALPAALAVSQESLPTSAGGAVPAAPDVSSVPIEATQGTEAEQLAAATAAALNSGQAPIEASPSNPAPQVAIGPSGISRENDFAGVSALRSIESDAQLIATNRAHYEQVQPTAVPTRTGSDGPNIVDFALKTSHPVGKPMYRRGGLGLASRTERNCAKYPSPDMAQSAFLSKGGPDKDRLGLDPDGDGYACAWDPRPFRKAVGG
ncbi:hypothetical protein [Thalassovita taeanensis]|uniref:Excalibur calcium-binding domain-containing protein n=1 Tax=Thalassovita taeanensis TaxID=657014 RepID=A0A1H9G425_9RHOB|nr:hypothetical protein SAMN04488092_10732 [Thalassovita taeanensis]